MHRLTKLHRLDLATGRTKRCRILQSEYMSSGKEYWLVD